jgi:hypothetical protein
MLRPRCCLLLRRAVCSSLVRREGRNDVDFVIASVITVYLYYTKQPGITKSSRPNKQAEFEQVQ